MSIGYKSPEGWFGLKFGYKPNILKRNLQITIGAGFGYPESFRLSSGFRYSIPLKNVVKPMIDISYSFATKRHLSSEDQTGSVEIGTHQYLATAIGCLIYPKKTNSFFVVQTGYSSLISAIDLYQIPGSRPGNVDYYQYYSKRLKSSLFVQLGIGIDF